MLETESLDRESGSILTMLTADKKALSVICSKFITPALIAGDKWDLILSRKLLCLPPRPISRKGERVIRQRD
jgi:hypothetical protein